MFSQEAQQKIILAHNRFMNGEQVLENALRPEILQSWIRSKNYGVKVTTDFFPPRLPREDILKRIDDYRKYGREKNARHIDTEHDLLKSINTSQYYIDETGVIIICIGQKITKLTDINLGRGSTISEAIIGTTAFALQSKDRENEICWVFGSEHYCTQLHDYVSASISYNTDYHGRTTVMVVTPLTEFFPKKKLLLEYLLSAHTIDMYNKPSSIQQMKTALLEINGQNSKLSQIFVDNDGIIIYANQVFFDAYNITPLNILGKPLTMKYPELKEALTCLKTGQNINMREVNLRKSGDKKILSLMDCQPINYNNKNLGVAITLSDRQSIQKIAQKVTNLHAHYSFDNLIGYSSKFLHIKVLAKKAALGPSPVLLLGESGSGKELFAQSIHNASPRKNAPFVSLNCSAIPRELIGSELFGYVEGAFTGAKRGGYTGKFELADRGTLFLDEIAEMPLDMQSVLLRAIEEKEITRLGSNNPISVDTRIIAATNRDLSQMIESGKFRKDLYFRLNVIQIKIVPLRDRIEDIPLLIEHFANAFSGIFGKPPITFSPEAMSVLLNYDWPGNIRELRNVVETCINLCPDIEVPLAYLPEEINSGNITTLNYDHKLTSQQMINHFPNKQNLNDYLIPFISNLTGCLQEQISNAINISLVNNNHLLGTDFSKENSFQENNSGKYPEHVSGSYPLQKEEFMDLDQKSITEVICQLDKYEAPVISALLEKYDGNKAKVAAKMGISRTCLYQKIKKYNIT